MATVVGVPLWLCRRLDQRLADPGWRDVATLVHELETACERLTVTIDRRLRSLEESAARAEAEIRFMGSLLGDPGQACSTPPRPNSKAAQVERPPTTGMTLSASHEGREGGVEGVTA